jgi:hypothetical protein
MYIRWRLLRDIRAGRTGACLDGLGEFWARHFQQLCGLVIGEGSDANDTAPFNGNGFDPGDRDHGAAHRCGKHPDQIISAIDSIDDNELRRLLS